MELKHLSIKPHWHALTAETAAMHVTFSDVTKPQSVTSVF